MALVRRKRRVIEVKTVSGEEIENTSKKSKVETEIDSLHLPAPLLTMLRDPVLNHKIKQQVPIVLIYCVRLYGLCILCLETRSNSF